MFESALEFILISANLLFLFYLRHYITKKSENLATREDVGLITKIVEDAKHASSLKKEVFTEYVEEVNSIFMTLTGFLNINASEQDLSESIKKSSGRSSKLHVVASLETLELAFELSILFHKCLTSAILERKAIIDIRQKIHVNEHMREKIIDQINSISETLSSVAHDVEIQDHKYKMKINILNEQKLVEQKEFDIYLKEYFELKEKMSVEEIRYIKKLSSELNNILEFYPSLLLSIRNELGYPLDEVDYMKVSDKHIKMFKNMNDKAIVDLTEKYRFKQSQEKSQSV